MRAGTRLKLALAAFAVAASALSATPAVAASRNPQATNVPYVAWRGEHIRMVKCDSSLRGEGQTANWLVVDWSGSSDVFMPTLIPGTQHFFTKGEGEGTVGCYRATFESMKAGLGQIKLAVTDDSSGDTVLVHQFVGIWLQINKPSIDEVGADDPTGDPFLGDPAGDGQFNAGAANGRVQVKVTGTFPLLQNYNEWGLGDSATLPDDWAEIAGKLATSDDPHDPVGINPNLWDIHDDWLPTEGHAGDNPCLPRSGNGIDAVDNCFGDFSFSNIFGLSDVPSYGPFDPQRPGETLLPDGKVDAGDAPMPAVRLDVTIASNSGNAGDISGVGSLEPASKVRVYSRNHVGTVDDNPNTHADEHNLYAPFYAQWIPATAAGPFSSGIDGGPANNFNGFLVDGLYWNWDFATVLSEATGTSDCLRGGNDVFRPLPHGAQSVVVYTDEHGEAQVEYNPGLGFFFDNLPGVIPNINGGCDLQGVDVLGTSDINATARYPYQTVTAPDMASDTITKTVHNLFDKSLSYYPKGAGSDNNVARIVVAHGNDIDGTPFTGEIVCFSADANAEDLFIFQGLISTATPPFSVNGPEVADPRDRGRPCARLDINGNAAVEVLDSNPNTVNVIAEYVTEKLFRHIFVDFATPGSTGGTPPPITNPGGGGGETSKPPAVTPPAAGSPGTTAPTAGQLASAGLTSVAAPAAPAPAQKAAAKKTARLAVARITKTVKGRYLYVRVNGTAKSAKLRVTLVSKNNKAMRTVVRYVVTNKLVKVNNLSISKAVKTARVSVVR